MSSELLSTSCKLLSTLNSLISIGLGGAQHLVKLNPCRYVLAKGGVGEGRTDVKTHTDDVMLFYPMCPDCQGNLPFGATAVGLSELHPATSPLTPMMQGSGLQSPIPYL